MRAVGEEECRRMEKVLDRKAEIVMEISGMFPRPNAADLTQPDRCGHLIEWAPGLWPTRESRPPGENHRRVVCSSGQ